MNGWLTRTALSWGRRLFVWGAVRTLADYDPARVKMLVEQELACTVEAVRTHIVYHDVEVRVQSERLMRRYDLGGALNEAAQRAIQQKAAVPPGYPTEQQKAALKLQEETLKDRIRRS